MKLNPDKTEFLLIGNERQWSIYLSMFPIELLGVKTNPAKSTQNLGVIFDKNFTSRSHIHIKVTVCMPQIPVRFLCRTHSRYLRCRLEAKMA